MAQIIRTYNEVTKRYESNIEAPTKPSLQQEIHSLTTRVSSLEIALVALINKR